MTFKIHALAQDRHTNVIWQGKAINEIQTQYTYVLLFETIKTGA